MLQASTSATADNKESTPGPTAQQECTGAVSDAKENNDSLNHHDAGAGALTAEKSAAAPRSRLSLKKRMKLS